MTPIVQFATAGMTAWVAAYAGTCGVALARAARSKVPVPTAGGPAPSVLLVRPCTGDDATLEPALRSTAELRYGGPLEIRLCVESRDDPAWGPVRRAARWLHEQGHDANAVVAPTKALNRKVGQLAEVTRDAEHDIVVCVDADVDLSGFGLERLLAPLDSDAVAAVWAPPVEVGALQGLGDRASAAVLGASLHAFNLLGELDPSGLVGKTFAVRSDALCEIGGFDGLSEHLGEDMELARRLREQGRTTTMLRSPVRAIASARSMGGVLARYTRWLWVIRAQRPALLLSYPLLLAAAPMLLGLLALLAVLAPLWSLGLGALVLFTRIAVALAAAAPRGRRVAAVTHEWLLADVVLLLAFARALGKPRVSWRDRTLRLGPGGRLRAVDGSLGG
ncbi:MAG: glycosyltransferase [Nannocystales bacterium]